MVVNKVGFYFPRLLSNVGENWYKIFVQKSSSVFVGFVQIGTGKALLFLSA
jgi:hypothetical protein